MALDHTLYVRACVIVSLIFELLTKSPNLESRKLEIPFQEPRHADIAVQVLKPDPILKPEDFQVEYSRNGSNFVVEFASIDERVLRVGVSSVIDSIKTVLESIDELDCVDIN